MKTLINILQKYFNRLVKRFKKKNTMITNQEYRALRNLLNTLRRKLANHIANDPNHPESNVNGKLAVQIEHIQDTLMDIERDFRRPNFPD